MWYSAEIIDFPDYTTQELDQIFELMARQNNFCVSADAMDNFEKRIVEERKLKSFGNARTVRNILDKAINKHTLNLKDGVIAMEDKFMLRAADVETKVDKNRFDL